MFLQRDNPTAHSGAATSAPIENIVFEFVPPPLPATPIWHRLSSACLQLSRKTSKEFISLVMKKCFREQPKEFYIDVLEKHVQGWRCCIELEGHYLKK
jgi:hypothetical protein